MAAITTSFYEDFIELKTLQNSLAIAYNKKNHPSFLDSIKNLIPFYEQHCPIDGEMPLKYRLFWMKGLERKITPEIAKAVYADTYEDRLQLVNFEKNLQKKGADLRSEMVKTKVAAEKVYSFFVRRFIFIGCASPGKDFTVEKLQYMKDRIHDGKGNLIDFNTDPKLLMLRSGAMTNACSAENWKILKYLIKQKGDLSSIDATEVIIRRCHSYTILGQAGDHIPRSFELLLEKMLDYSTTFHNRLVPWVDSQLSRPEARMLHNPPGEPQPLESFDQTINDYIIYSTVRNIPQVINSLNERVKILEACAINILIFIRIIPVANIVISYLNNSPELQFTIEYGKPTKDPVEKKNPENDVLTPL